MPHYKKTMWFFTTGVTVIFTVSLAVSLAIMVVKLDWHPFAPVEHYVDDGPPDNYPDDYITEPRYYLDNEDPKPSMEHDLRYRVMIEETLRGDWSQTNGVGSIFIDCVIEARLDCSLFDPSYWINCTWTDSATSLHTDFDGSVWYNTPLPIKQYAPESWLRMFHKAQFSDTIQHFRAKPQHEVTP